jgi:hypothetical protein
VTPVRPRKVHIRLDADEAYCGLRMLPADRLTDRPRSASCAMCIEAMLIDGHPTPRVSGLSTPLVDVPGAIEATREIGEYLQAIRAHDAAHRLADVAGDGGEINDINDTEGVPLPKGVTG